MLLKKKIDSRLRTLIENGANTKQRSIFFLVGDNARDQVVNLHLILSKTRVRAQPNVLWCYKTDLGFSSSKQRRAEKIRQQVKNGVRDKEAEDPFELFLCTTDIRYTYYKETDRVLGQTFGMCVLQDFESLTPNILARTIETVEGGGIICILLKNMSSLTQLYKMSMDVHSKYTTDAFNDIKGRFNERFILSLANCKNCVVVDDELNILPISNHVHNIKKINKDGSVQSLTGEIEEQGRKDIIFENDEILTPRDVELRDLKRNLEDTQPIGSLIALAKTLDQGKSLLTFAEAIADKSLKSTVALLAARGRGKSAALGISLACAVAYGYANIFVTAPTPENLVTLFAMTIQGLKAIGYKEHVDYEIVQSLNPKLNKAIVRINIFHTHRQTIQYIAPHEHTKLAQAELLVIDEAAAIPLPFVQKLMGPYLVFISSTVNGYEGTGRALSLKLIKQLREQCGTAHHSAFSQNNKDAHKLHVQTEMDASLKGRTLREITLNEPIRYVENDPVEAWLNELLCLNCASTVPKLSRNFAGATGVPHPSLCDLYYVERDTLFAYHKATESFLQKMMSLYISSHYKNSPNDLQLMADAPAHQLYVLLGPQNSNTSGTLPDIIGVVQVCLEGDITSSTYNKHNTANTIASGDLIPWCISKQYQNPEFAGLSGARIVRVAVHPELQNMGYGSRAVNLLKEYFDGKFTNLEEFDDSEEETMKEDMTIHDIKQVNTTKSSLLNELVLPKKSNKPLLTKLSDRKPETLHWLGVSFGLTVDLHKFWSKNQFTPLYIRQTVNDVTGEHTCVMVKPIISASSIKHANSKNISHGFMNPVTGEIECKWLDSFSEDFSRRFVALLGYEFRNMSSILAYHVLHTNKKTTEELEGTNNGGKLLSMEELNMLLTPFDIRRLETYSMNMIDYHLILDLLPTLARTYFYKKTNLQFTDTQASSLLALGLQFKQLHMLEKELSLGGTQLLALFNKSIRKYVEFIMQVKEQVYISEMKENTKKQTNASAMSILTKNVDDNAVTTSLQNDLNAGAKVVMTDIQKKQNHLLASLSLEKYAISVNDADWNANVDKLATAATTGKSVSLKASDEKAKQQRAFKDQGDRSDKLKKTNKRKEHEEDAFSKRVRGDMKKKYEK